MLQKFKEAMQHKSEKRMIALGLIAIILIGGVAISRFGLGKATQNTDNQAVAVQAMRVVRKDASATYEYVGQVKAKSQVKVMTYPARSSPSPSSWPRFSCPSPFSAALRAYCTSNLP